MQPQQFETLAVIRYGATSPLDLLHAAFFQYLYLGI
jgi:hypothetical protein